MALGCLLLAVSACGGGEYAPMTAETVEWGYDGLIGPEHWASLSEEYASCAYGKQQSPVDIAGYEEGNAGPIWFSYGGNATSVHNDGLFVHFDYAPGNTLSFGQQSFELQSAHLHSLSEHTIDGVSFAAELHLVHADAGGNLAAVGLLFRLGEPSPMVDAILNAAPAAGDTVSDGITLNASDYAPGEKGYYQYVGSKTTPPCHEPVSWYLMHELKTISPEQVNSLLELSGGPNNRPVQPTGSRVITISSAP